MTAAVNRSQRWNLERPCPICGGHDRLMRGKGTRCSGYMGADGKYAHCSREELSGGLKQERGETYAHRLEGPCACGETHGHAPVIPITHRAEQRMPDGGDFREVARWDYEGGLRVIRAEAPDGRKVYWQQHRNGAGYVRGRGNAPATLYRAPELRAADPLQWIFLVEGEKCADALAAVGLLATTSPGGASQWAAAAPAAAQLLAKRHVVILPDNDEPGRKYAEAARATLGKVCASLRVLELPGLGPAEDVADWLGRGGDGEELVRLAEAQPSVIKARIEWISTSGIFAPLPPTPWLSRDLGLCPGRPSMIAAYGYSGKTVMAQASVLALTTGRDIWGHFPVVRTIRARHFDYEQGRHASIKRYQRLALGMGIDPREIAGRLELCVFPDVYLNSSDAIDVYARETEGYGLAILDALRGAAPGEDENDSSVRRLIDMLSRVSEKNGTVFELIHHAGKTKDSHKDARMVLRGSSGIFDACGSVLVLTGEHDEPRKVQQVKAPAEAEGSSIAPFHLAIEDVAVNGNPRGGLRVVYQEIVTPPEGAEDAAPKQAGRPKTSFADVRQAVLAVVMAEPGLPSASAIVARCTVGSRADRFQAINELEQEKRIVQVGGGFRVSK
jgi:hypothetical protein